MMWLCLNTRRVASAFFQHPSGNKQLGYEVDPAQTNPFGESQRPHLTVGSYLVTKKLVTEVNLS